MLRTKARRTVNLGAAATALLEEYAREEATWDVAADLGYVHDPVMVDQLEAHRADEWRALAVELHRKTGLPAQHLYAEFERRVDAGWLWASGLGDALDQLCLHDPRRQLRRALGAA